MIQVPYERLVYINGFRFFHVDADTVLMDNTHGSPNGLLSVIEDGNEYHINPLLLSAWVWEHGYTRVTVLVCHPAAMRRRYGEAYPTLDIVGDWEGETVVWREGNSYIGRAS